MSTTTLAPTARLRFTSAGKLQQWWAEDVPKYMRSTSGEWKDVPTSDEAHVATPERDQRSDAAEPTAD